MTTMAAVPGAGRVIAGVSEQGLWASDDGGKTWKKLGDADSVQITNRPYQIVFDPLDPQIFWMSGSAKGPGLFQTSDAGKTFTPLGNVTQVEGLGIDFTDPLRKTLVIGHHEQARSVEKSIDGGQAWQKSGSNIPENSNFPSDVVVFDANTFLANAAGWQQGGSFGIFRTDDGGAMWARVSDAGPAGPPCVVGDVIYWQALWAKGLIRGTGRGKAWQPIEGPVKDNPIALPNGRLIAPVDKQLFVSADAGKSWQKLGPKSLSNPAASATTPNRARSTLGGPPKRAKKT